ncbi:MAG: type II toxin-antitoxin system prevent-host-death family antitoxin [Acidimicrobiales bacterium]
MTERSDTPSTTLGIRQLRADVAAVVRRAAAGERVVITVGGAPMAQLGPIEPGAGDLTLWDLATTGLVEPPRRTDRPPDPNPVPVPADLNANRLLDATRGR